MLASPTRSVDKSCRKGSMSSVESFSRDRLDTSFWSVGGGRSRSDSVNLFDFGQFDPLHPITQFDIEVPDDSPPLSPSPSMRKQVLSINRKEFNSSKVIRANPDRVPCPRLCGATFGKGNGKMVCFRNGALLKMWIRLVNDEINKGSKSQNNPDLALQSKKNAMSTPRTLSDLLKLVKASKKAQWGDDEETESDASSIFVSNSEDSFDDSQVDSDSYLGPVKDGAIEALSVSTGNHNILDKSFHNREKVFLSSETLAPVVEYKSILDAQSPDLARAWKLGDWNEVYDFNKDQIKSESSAQSNQCRLSANQQQSGRDISSEFGGFEKLKLSTRSLPLPDPSLLLISRKSEFPRPSSFGSHLSREAYSADDISFDEKYVCN